SGTGLTSRNITMNGAKTATANWNTDAAGPITSAESIAPTPTNAPPTVTATVDDSTTGNSDVQRAEYFIDAVGSNGAGTAMSASDLAFDSPTEGVTATLSSLQFSALSQGTHTIYVHGQDYAGNWG